ncbi:precorrin-6y C5,15-methyltransferase (decarboxylating) subunit CbiE [Brevibacillus ginsengisoli]|uniref:precorrin-6y C5,15-methyltransferase (decarboxylating) subunit CbiE n=1 Tax=Brevibacillus ginsengisoli TaxID=363854 RepID=UPI003CF49BD1
MTQPMKLIGIGDSGKASLLPIYERWIDECERLVGGERHLSFFPDYRGEKVVIKGGIAPLIERLVNEPKQTVILASGDPLCYGIGALLARQMKVEIYPYLSSIQLAFAKMGESWQDAYITSVHGRSIKGLAQRIDGRHKVALLTDEENHPGIIASYLKSFGMTEYRAFIAENLGSDTERAGWYELDELEHTTFSPLNVVILHSKSRPPEWTIGIEDDQFFQRKPEKGLITKKEIRTLSLSALKLKKDSIVWDIGTCTGSMAIEAAKIANEGMVYAIEKNEPDLENCRKNMSKFRADITLVHGRAPEHLEQFPDPDAVFIGGTSDELDRILDVCCSRLKPDGRIVINAVTIEKLTDAIRLFKEKGMETDITLAQISRSKPILQLTRFEAHNPIYIISARQEGGV